MKKPLHLILIITFTCVSFAHASDTSHRAAVEKLLLAMNVQNNVSTFVEQMRTSSVQAFKQMNVPEEDLPMVNKMMDRQLQITKEELSWENLKGGIVDSYMKVYSEEEVVELTKFFASPIGTKYVSKQPELLEEMTKAYQARLPILTERYKRIPEEIAEEMQKDQEVKAKGTRIGL